MVLFAYWLPASLENMYKHFRFLRRQVNTCDFYHPKKLADLWQLKDSDPDRVFILRPPKDGFVIGQRPWRLSKLRENVIVFGSVGSGKTICVMNAFLDNLIASRGSPSPLGGLILDYKGDFHEKTVRLCQRYGRSEDLIVLSPESEHKWNPVDGDEPANEIAARFVATMKALGQKDKNTSFFGDQAETLLENAIVLLRQSNPPGQSPTIADIYRIANDFEFLQARLDALPEHAPHALLSDPLFRCRYYFENEFYSLPDEVRQSVVATLNNMLNPLCTEKIASIIHNSSTLDLREATQGPKIVYLHLPAAKAPKAGRVMGMLLKLAFFAEVKKKSLDTGRYSFLFADEFQEFFTSEGEGSDTRFFAISRQYDQINVIATQNLNNFTMLGDKKDAVKSFLSNVKTKVFLQNSDKDTNDYAAELFGQYVAELGGMHNGANAQLLPYVRSADFIRLRSPEKGSCAYCESFILNEAASKVDTANRSARWPVHAI
jgi:type IV secretory pathway TraG/TraD family ATPase VirD4